jgi:hypothetical protein
MKATYTQSIVGVGNTDLGMLERGLGRRRAQDTPVTVAWNGWSYLVGSGVERYARPVERMDLQRLSDGVELRALTYKTLYDLAVDLPPDQRAFAVMVGLPVEVMANADQAKATRRTIRSWLMGDHTLAVDGDALTLTIHKVQVMGQPAGAYHAWAFDDAGRWARDRADQRALVGIGDIGFNTLDLYSVQGGRIQGRYTDGDSLGMRRAAELVIDAVRRQHGVTLSKHRADALLHRRRPALFVGGQQVDLATVVAQARASNEGSVLAFFEATWDNGRQFGYLLFTGGGAESLRPALLRQYPHGVVLPDAVTANALGLARAARRTLHKYAPHVIGLDPGFGGFKAVRL